MTAVAGGGRDHGAAIIRWGGGFAAVLSVHAIFGTLLLTRDSPRHVDASPPAVFVDLAPVSAQGAAHPAVASTALDEAEPAPPVASSEPAPPVASSEPATVARQEPAQSAEPDHSEALPQPAPGSVPHPQPTAIARSAAVTPPTKPAAKPVPPRPRPVTKREAEPKPKTVAEPEPKAKPTPKPEPATNRAARRPPAARAAETATSVPSPALRRSQPASAGARIRTASIASEGASQSSASLPAWHALVRTRLQALQRYPAEAQAMGQSGTTTVAFVIDRGGRVLSARVAASSGSAVLDQTSVATVRSASLPPPPSDVPGSTFNFSIPLRYRPR